MQKNNKQWGSYYKLHGGRKKPVKLKCGISRNEPE